MDEQTGVAKDQKHTPKKPYNTDMAICMSSDLGVRDSFRKHLRSQGSH